MSLARKAVMSTIFNQDIALFIQELVRKIAQDYDPEKDERKWYADLTWHQLPMNKLCSMLPQWRESKIKALLDEGIKAELLLKNGPNSYAFTRKCQKFYPRCKSIGLFTEENHTHSYY